MIFEMLHLWHMKCVYHRENARSIACSSSFAVGLLTDVLVNIGMSANSATVAMSTHARAHEFPTECMP